MASVRKSSAVLSVRKFLIFVMAADICSSRPLSRGFSLIYKDLILFYIIFYPREKSTFRDQINRFLKQLFQIRDHCGMLKEAYISRRVKSHKNIDIAVRTVVSP